MLGIEFLKFSSGVKQITISFDFVELIFIQLFLVQLTALSIDSCITDTSVVLQISNSVLSSTYFRASDFPRSRKSRGIRGIADLKRNLENSNFFCFVFFLF